MIGSWGPIIFMMSSLRKFSMKNTSRTVTYKYAQMEIIGGKPRLQAAGQDLEGFNMTLLFMAELGHSPAREMERITRIAERSEAYPLIIGGRPQGKNMFVITETPQELERISNRGKVLQMTVQVTMLEFVD